MDNDEALRFRVEIRGLLNVNAPVIDRLLRRVAYLHVLRQGTVPKRHYLPLGWMFVSGFWRLKPLEEFILFHHIPFRRPPASTGCFWCDIPRRKRGRHFYSGVEGKASPRKGRGLIRTPIPVGPVKL